MGVKCWTSSEDLRSLAAVDLVLCRIEQVLGVAVRHQVAPVEDRRLVLAYRRVAEEDIGVGADERGEDVVEGTPLQQRLQPAEGVAVSEDLRLDVPPLVL